MKKILTNIVMIFVLILLSLSGGTNTAYADGTSVTIDEINFPDHIFRNYVSEEFDRDSNGILDAIEIEDIKTVSIRGSFISDLEIVSLKGIEFFTELTDLDCAFQSLTELDVSKNTKLVTLICCDNHQLAELNVPMTPALEYLDCSYNQLTELDISKNPVLLHLDYRGNNLTLLNKESVSTDNKVNTDTDKSEEKDTSSVPQTNDTSHLIIWMFVTIFATTILNKLRKEY